MPTGYLYDVWVANYGLDNVTKIINETVQTPINAGTLPFAICVDKYGSVWIANGSNLATKIVNGVAQTSINVGTQPRGICVDKFDNIWVANNLSNDVTKIINGVAQTPIAVGNGPVGICADKLGNIWVANMNSNNVTKIINGVAQTPITVGSQPFGICVDKQENIWVTNSGSANITKIINGVAQSPIAVGDGPGGICVDQYNNIWVTNSGSNSITKIINGVAQTPITVGSQPFGICVDKQENIWVTNSGSANITKIINGVAQAPISVGNGPYNVGDATGMQSAMLFGWGPFAITRKYMFMNAADADQKVYIYVDGSGFSYMNPLSEITQANWDNSAQSVMPSPTELQTFVGSNGTVSILTRMSDATIPDTLLTATAVPRPQLIMATGDIDISNATNIDWIRVNNGIVDDEDGSGDHLYYAVSKDSGATWWTYNGTSWSQVGTNSTPTAEEIVAKYMRPTHFNDAPWQAWTLGANPPARTLRFAYVLDIQYSSDVAFNSQLSYQYDGGGPWEVATPGTQYTAKFISNTQLEVTFLIAGSRAKINY